MVRVKIAVLPPLNISPALMYAFGIMTDIICRKFERCWEKISPLTTQTPQDDKFTITPPNWGKGEIPS